MSLFHTYTGSMAQQAALDASRVRCTSNSSVSNDGVRAILRATKLQSCCGLARLRGLFDEEPNGASYYLENYM
jgi:hypothetical protein